MLNKGTGTKTWNERGVGLVKLLKHKTEGNIRALMRQERTMKIIMNHVVDPRLQLTPNAGSDKSWCWSAFDFADGESLVETIFALKFKDADIAGEFKAKYNECQEAMRAMGVGTEEEEAKATAEEPKKDDTEEVAEALAGLSTKEES